MVSPRGPGTLRRFCSEDLQQVAAIARTSFREQYTLDFFLGIWQIAPDSFLVVEHQGEIQGFVIGVQDDIGSARILMLAVAEKYRRQGIGSSLLRKFLRAMQGRAKKVTLEVRLDNLEAHVFYLHHDFQVKRTLKHFYTDGSDAFEMEKEML